MKCRDLRRESEGDLDIMDEFRSESKERTRLRDRVIAERSDYEIRY